VAFSLAKTTSSHGSRWDISWTAVAWLAASAAAIVSLVTLLDSGRRGMILGRQVKTCNGLGFVNDFVNDFDSSDVAEHNVQPNVLSGHDLNAL
jgi:hypothetical protein